MNWPSSSFLPFAFLLLVVRAQVNRTIDDEPGDDITGVSPVYTPSDGWSQGAKCQGCNIFTSSTGAGGVDVSRPFDSTWHDTTVDPHHPVRTISMNFTGKAVYVFNTIVNRHPWKAGTTADTYLNFFIDGEQVGQYSHIAQDNSDILYRVPVYTNSSLPYGEHTLNITAGGGPNGSLVLFDYVLYTVDDPLGAPSEISPSVSSSLPSLSTPTSVPSSTPQGNHVDSRTLAVVGAIAGILGFLACLAGVVVFRARKSIIRHFRRGPRSATPEGRRASLDASSFTPSSTDVNFAKLRSSLVSFSSISPPASLAPHDASALPFEAPAMQQSVPAYRYPSPPRHSVDVPSSVLSSSRSDQSSSLAELRREVRALQEKMRELRYPRKGGLQLVDGIPEAPTVEPREVSLAAVQEQEEVSQLRAGGGGGGSSRR